MDDVSLHLKFDELRSRAEQLLNKRGHEKTGQLGGIDIISLIHELEVHQIELEMQNEELRQARRDLEHASRAYSDLFEFAPVGYVCIGKAGMITRVNRTASAMLRIDKENLTDRGFSNFVHPLDHRKYFELIREGTGKENAEQTGEIRLLRAGVVPFYVQLDVLPFRDADGDSGGWRITFWDISDRKRAEEEQKNFSQKLQNSNRELQDFAFIASHDLQEPLRKIQTFADMVMRRSENMLDETSSDYLLRVQSSAGRMQELLRALLRYSRVGTHPEPFRDCNLNEAVRDAVSDLDILIQKTEGKIEISALPVIQADSAQIRQLFQNVITNALKFHRDGVPPVVKVYVVQSNADTCSIAVEDNGIGFDETFMAKIFAPFQRLHGNSSRYKGTGMGLAICRKIVERHGGSITATSTPGKGSTFIIRLPHEQSESNHPE